MTGELRGWFDAPGFAGHRLSWMTLKRARSDVRCRYSAALALRTGRTGSQSAVIPALLTMHYANLVSARLRGAAETPGDAETEWPLERIADTYELITSIHTDARFAGLPHSSPALPSKFSREGRRALSRGGSSPNIDRDRVDPAIAAALLFLAAEQYADANEAASAIRTRREGQLYEATILSESIADLARGQLGQIVDRGQRWRRPQDRPRSGRASSRRIARNPDHRPGDACGPVSRSAAQGSAGRFDGARHAFMRVLELSAASMATTTRDLGGDMLLAYAGPHHLASLLLAALDGISDAALTIGAAAGRRGSGILGAMAALQGKQLSVRVA